MSSTDHQPSTIDHRPSRVPLGDTGLTVTRIGFGAFKIGRNQKTKYPTPYDLPDEPTVERLLNRVLDLGVNYIDTAPAYGLSEKRIGRFLSHRRGEFVLSTKVGETFEEGESVYDFSRDAVRQSVERSLTRLKTDVLDIVFVHSDGNDRRVLNETDCASALRDLKAEGKIRAVGFSGKTVEGAELACEWADVLMVEYHRDDPSHADVMSVAAERGVGVVVKKGLASGRLEPAEAIRFVLRHPAAGSLVIGALNPENIRRNLRTAGRM
ncbi:MAG: aldo/keto reductase [Planctomycetaceae bacterium]